MRESLGESEVVVEMQVHTRANVSTAISSFNKLPQTFQSLTWWKLQQKDAFHCFY